jgi:hypothetical protein
MMTTQPIARLMDDLPTSGVTIYMLNGLDFVVPGQWKNITGFENMIRDVTGETDMARIDSVARRAKEIYVAPATPGYQRAMWLYQMVDTTDKALAAAAMASKIGEAVSFLSFMSRLAPKADTAQSIDFGLKLTAEMLAFGMIHGLPSDGITQFVQSLSTYSKENIMRLATLICVDGLIPLGPDFIGKVGDTLGQTQPTELQGNNIYQQMNSLIPGSNASQQLGFIQQLFDSTREWINNFQISHQLSPQVIIGSLQSVVDTTGGKLDYLAAFIDASTNYYEHTGTQSIARNLIAQAAKEVPKNVPRDRESVVSTNRLSGKKSRSSKIGDSPGQLKSQLETYLEELDYSYDEDDDGSLYVKIGSAFVYLTPYQWDDIDQPLIHVQATIASDIEEISKATAVELLEMNAEIPFGSLSYFEEDESINLCYALLSDLLDKNSLAIAINQVGQYADDLDDDIAKATGGQRGADGSSSRAKRTLHKLEKQKSEKKLWSEVESYLEELDIDYGEEDDNIVIEVGSTVVYIDVYKWEGVPQTIVELSGTVSADYEKVRRNTAINLLKANATEVPFGGFEIDTDDEAIYFYYRLMGDYLNMDILKLVIDWVGTVADNYDDEISDETGGYREQDM